MSYYSQDPYWTKAKFNGTKCRRCEKSITRGDDIFYYPKGKAVYCNGPLCGRSASAEFESSAADAACTAICRHHTGGFFLRPITSAFFCPGFRRVKAVFDGTFFNGRKSKGRGSKMHQREAILKHLEAADNIAGEIGDTDLQSILRGLRGAIHAGEDAHEIIWNYAQAAAKVTESYLALIKKGKP